PLVGHLVGLSAVCGVGKYDSFGRLLLSEAALGLANRTAIAGAGVRPAERTRRIEDQLVYPYYPRISHTADSDLRDGGNDTAKAKRVATKGYPADRRQPPEIAQYGKSDVGFTADRSWENG